MPNTKFDSKSFNPEAFGRYVERIPNVKKNQLIQSGAVGTNENAKTALASQTGSLYARIPYFGRISGATSQNNDGGTDITSTSTTTYEQGFVTASRMDSWTERSFSKNITAGVDFMDNVARQIADYKLEVKQAMLLAILNGVFSMSTTGGSVAAKAAKEFIDKHTYDISGKTGEDALVGATTLNTAIQQACGDNKNIFKLVIMHSAVATRLENLRLLKYMTYTDKDGIQHDLALGTWNGRTVLIDDDMPAESLEAGGTKYTTYVLGEGAIVLDDIGDSVPYEMSRDPKTNGGQDTLFVRDRYICGVDGISFEKPASVTASASNADLKAGANWNVINDGKEAISHKAIAIVRIISQG
ncbi:major capsid protein [Anaerotruncus sp. 1XD42-93]|uniref:major capsid protein n=1 Tax=Anaerotruncus sp. 1XD42-93 TaxID=2320853 RepID=UPI000EA3FCDE|nr:major capsid protein [Anaerotruncus sp. 1XD42-93]NBK18603.1 phage coat protein [Anaerotruncus sp. 1XD42-93]RKJ79789.1 phage coat protein [Anaerotruncus sp. 1XD22-93]